MRNEIRKEIKNVEPFDALERETKANILSWIDSGVELCRLKKPATPPKHLIAYFPVVDGDYVLLVDHIKAGLWLPAGGHVEPGEHPRAAALREAKEELSIEGEFLHEQAQFLTITETIGKTPGHTDVSIWYTLQGDRSATLKYDNSEFLEARWFHKDEVPLGRTDKHMSRFLSKLYPGSDSNATR